MSFNLLTLAAWQVFFIDPPVGPVPVTGFVQSGKNPALYIGYKRVS